eukprot:TRINITY_DN10906_c0_g1_i1.p1 TRINITY_DN10906_c0_g1~~TRINITY_DN10906_c0_g1_i1.p1  ORF type:complete len:246 (-),score=49.81 TRINITY_DN10906_c0_g1_i1:27-764(-)
MTLRVLSQNLNSHYLTTGSGDKQTRIDQFITVIENYDVILVQELFEFHFLFKNYTFIDHLVTLAEQIGFEYSFCDRPDLVFGQNNGLLILSRYPIVNTQVVLSEGHWADPGTSKGAIMAEIEFNEKLIALIDLHLDAHFQYVRRSQFTTIIRAIEEMDYVDGIIVSGDFNTIYPSDHDYFRETFERIKFEEVFGGMDIQTFRKYNFWLDHIYVKGLNLEEGSQTVEDFDGVSDHFGLSCIFTIEE